MPSVPESAYTYASMVLRPWQPRSPEDAARVHRRRSELHTEIAEALDIDESLVAKALEDASRNHPPGVYTAAWDSFIDNLLRASKLPPEKRHPNRLTEKQLDEIAKDLADAAILV